MKNVIGILFLVFLFSECSTKKDAQHIIDQTIQAHGGEAYNPSSLTFTFRDKQYTSVRNGGNYTYTRSFQDTSGHIKDVLDNEGFTRSVNNEPIELSEEWKARYSASVNSVIYFALLPYGLNDAAAQKTYIKEEIVQGQSYDVIQVTFQEEGGGEDFQDVFYYWIHQNDKTMDYLAYSYDESDGKGIRFRKAINPRIVAGIRMQDYINYKPTEIVPLDDLVPLFEKGALKELSRIILEF